jgi:hypothetical protein
MSARGVNRRAVPRGESPARHRSVNRPRGTRVNQRRGTVWHRRPSPPAHQPARASARPRISAPEHRARPRSEPDTATVAAGVISRASHAAVQDRWPVGGARATRTGHRSWPSWGRGDALDGPTGWAWAADRMGVGGAPDGWAWAAHRMGASEGRWDSTRKCAARVTNLATRAAMPLAAQRLTQYR